MINGLHASIIVGTGNCNKAWMCDNGRGNYVAQVRSANTTDQHCHPHAGMHFPRPSPPPTTPTSRRKSGLYMDSNGYGGQRSEFIRLGAMAMEGVVGGVWRCAGAVCGCVLRGEEERVGGRRSTV